MTLPTAAAPEMRGPTQTCALVRLGCLEAEAKWRDSIKNPNQLCWCFHTRQRSRRGELFEEAPGPWLSNTASKQTHVIGFGIEILASDHTPGGPHSGYPQNCQTLKSGSLCASVSFVLSNTVSSEMSCRRNRRNRRPGFLNPCLCCPSCFFFSPLNYSSSACV